MSLEFAENTEKSVLTDPPKAWITYVRKDGKGRHCGTVSTNPDYVRMHNEWVWLQITLPEPPK